MGLPVLRPLWVEFPRDKNTWASEDQFMVGDSLLVHPVTEQGATSVQLYLPGTSAVSVGGTLQSVFHAATRRIFKFFG